MGKEKDPNKPKRPLSGYFLFMGDERSKVRDEHPDWKTGQIGKELGNRWNNLDAGRKKKKPRTQTSLNMIQMKSLRDVVVRQERRTLKREQQKGTKRKTKKERKKKILTNPSVLYLGISYLWVMKDPRLEMNIQIGKQVK